MQDNSKPTPEEEIRQISEELTKAYEEINFLYEIGRDLNSTLDVDTICRIAMEKARGVIPAESASIRLLSEYYKLKNFHGWGPLIELGDIYLDQGIIGQVFGSGKPILINDVVHSSYNSIKLLNYSSFLGVPLITAANEVIGVIILANFSPDKNFFTSDKTLLVALATQAAVAIESARYHQQLIEQNQLEEDLRVAKRIQNNLLPDHIPNTYPLDIAVFYETAREVGGDYFDFFPLDKDSDSRTLLGFALGDAMGKGIPAAMVMAMARSVLKATMMMQSSPKNVMKALNKSLYEDIDKAGIYLTLWYGMFDFTEYHLKFTSAGAPPFLHFSQGNIVENEPVDPMIGVNFEADYSEFTVSIHKGDLLLFFTDGVTEIKSLDGEMFGLNRLKGLLLENTRKTPEEIKFIIDRDIKSFSGESFSDDVAFIIMRVL